MKKSVYLETLILDAHQGKRPTRIQDYPVPICFGEDMDLKAFGLFHQVKNNAGMTCDVDRDIFLAHMSVVIDSSVAIEFITDALPVFTKYGIASSMTGITTSRAIDWRRESNKAQSYTLGLYMPLERCEDHSESVMGFCSKCLGYGFMLQPSDVSSYALYMTDVLALCLVVSGVSERCCRVSTEFQ